MSKLVEQPISVVMPAYGVVVAESVHAPGFRMADRAEPFHKLVFLQAGTVDYTAVAPRQTPLRVTTGNTIVVSAGVRHRFDDVAPATLFIIGLARGWVESDRALEEAWQRLSARRQPVLAPDEPLRRMLERRVRRMLAEQVRGDWGAGLAVRSDALRLLVDLGRLPDGIAVTGAIDRVRAVLARMQETFYETWNLNDAAEAAGLSRRRFTQLFVEVSGGRTFLAVLTGLRLAHAAELLARPNHSITGAAFSSGFGDLSHFYRLFRQRYGEAPGEWRKENPEKLRHKATEVPSKPTAAAN